MKLLIVDDQTAVSEALRRGTELLFGLEYHLYRRDVVVSAAQVEAKRRLEGRERHLVDAQRAKQLVLLEFCDELFFADDAADLRPAEQLVAREGDEVAAGLERLRDGRVVLARKARRREVYQHSAAEVLHEDEAAAVRERRQLLARDGGVEARDAVVRGVNL